MTEEEVVLGQILSDVSQLPQQFGPLRDGLAAAVKRINDGGGVCGRTLRVEYRNDNATPSAAFNAYQELKDEVFVFAAIGSLMDQVWYQDSPPYHPRPEVAGDSLVPDIGGQGFSNNRAQSPFHFSPLGSLSPVLTGGTAFKGFQSELRGQGTECTFAGVAYLQEPTGASEQQAETGRLAIASPQGMDIGTQNTAKYGVPLAAPVAQWEATIQQMIGDGVDCMFVYGDLGSAANAVQAARNRQVWPPESCTLNCFQLVWSPYTIYDAKFVNAVGDAGRHVHTFLPHLPFEENAAPTAAYIRDLRAIDPDLEPTTFGALGYESGMWVRDALVACGAAPTRECVLEFFRTKQDYQSTGLFGPITPFRSSRAAWQGTTWDWRWVFNCTIRMQLQNRGGGLEWVRTGPQGFECGDLQVVRQDA